MAMDTKTKKSGGGDYKIFDEKRIKKNIDVMRRGFSNKTWLHLRSDKNKNDGNEKNVNSRFLITVNIFGSAGPLRFVASGNDNAAGVIGTTLKLYSREGRLPILGSDTSCFILYPANAEFEAIKPSEAIGSYGVRNFVMSKNEGRPSMTEGRSKFIESKKGSRWRVWLQKSISLKI